MCPECAKLRRKVAALEEALEGAVYPTLNGIGLLALKLKISPQQAEIIEMLYRAGGRFVKTAVLMEGLRYSETATRLYGEDRVKNHIAVQVSNLRKKLTPDFVETKVTSGYRLPPASMSRVAAIMKEVE